jgi:PTS system nitrogen regulatory IIA component
MSEEMLTVEEIAKELRVSAKTVRSWITSGELVALDIGREYRISRANFEDFKQRRQTDRRKKTNEIKKEL